MGVAAVILAGGRSRRMGRDKVFLPLGGKALFEYVWEVCRGIFQEVVVVTDKPDRFSPYPLKVKTDLVSAGVLGGLYTGLKAIRNPYAFCVACDLPFLKKEVVLHLLSLRDRFDAVVPLAPDGVHPLVAVYSKGCLEAVEKNLKEGRLRLSELFPLLRVRFCTVEELKALDPTFISFFNINTPEDLRKAEEKLRGGLIVSPKNLLFMTDSPPDGGG